MNTLCNTTDCKRKHYARGFCRSHYAKLRRSKRLGLLPPPEPKFCSVDGCGKLFSAKGLCEKHYREHKVKANPVRYGNSDKKRTERARHNKERVVRKMGGRCVLCGYNKNIACLEFHHKNPLEKEFTPKTLLRGKDMTIIMKEINKCILVCKNCHTDIHHPLPEYKVLTAP
jgi:hypothetical protein